MEEKISTILEPEIEDNEFISSIIESFIEAISDVEPKTSGNFTFISDFLEEIIQQSISDYGTEGEIENITVLDKDINYKLDYGNEGEIENISVLDKVVSKNNTFYWMSYIFLHYLGYKLYLNYVNEIKMRKSTTSMEEMSALIVDLVNEVVENGEYLNIDSEDPQKIARNLIWSLLNSPALTRRYQSVDAKDFIVKDVLSELLDKVTDVGELVGSDGYEEEDNWSRLSNPSDISSYYEISFQEQTPEILKRECIEISGVHNVADDFIKTIVTEANCKVEDLKKKLRMSHQTDVESSFHYPMKFKFPEIRDFNIAAGKKAIDQFLNLWEFQEDWKYRSDFLIAQSDECSDYYFYEVIWCLPTPMFPIAQATASVFFKIEVSRVIPPSCIVNVSYKYECNSYEHTPFQTKFDEKQLIYILNMKLQLFKEIKF